MPFDPVLADRLRALLDGEPGLAEKRMFGGLAFLLDGTLAIGASHTGGLMLRCRPDRTADLLAEPGAGPMVMRGRAMDGWLRVDAAAVPDDAALRRWVDVGVEAARAAG